jgi:hypothetical protein
VPDSHEKQRPGRKEAEALNGCAKAMLNALQVAVNYMVMAG